MKSKFIFIHCSGTITAKTVVYQVYLGRSKADQRYKRFFESLSFNNDYYFHVYDQTVADFMYNLKMQFMPADRVVADVPNVLLIQPGQLKQMVLSGQFGTAPLPKGYSYMTSAVDVKYRVQRYRQTLNR